MSFQYPFLQNVMQKAIKQPFRYTHLHYRERVYAITNQNTNTKTIVKRSEKKNPKLLGSSELGYQQNLKGIELSDQLLNFILNKLLPQLLEIRMH